MKKPRTRTGNSRPLRSAAFLMIGTELLKGRIIDTNSQWLASRLLESGLSVVAIEKTGDERAAIAAAVRRLLRRADLVITSGGLGPTFDDLTFAGVAAGARRSLRRNEQAARWLRDALAGFQKKRRAFTPAMMKAQYRQAKLPSGGIPLHNLLGTAPGLWLEIGRTVVVCLPGVPREMKGLMEAAVLPRLRGRLDGAVASRHYRFAPMFESMIEAAIGPRLKKINSEPGLSVTVLARPGECSLILCARGATTGNAEARLRRIAGPLLKALPQSPYTDRGEPPEAVAMAQLENAGASLSLAESLTGGLIAERLTRIPGASRSLAGAMITYQDRIKRKLGVPRAVLKKSGAVSAAAARAMARAARKYFSTDYALSATGYAGPGGGDSRHPVGSYFVALAGPRGRTRVEYFQAAGDRQLIRERAATHALMLLINALLKI